MEQRGLEQEDDSWLSVEVGEEVGHLVDADAVEAGVGDAAFETAPDGDGDVLGGRDEDGELGDFEVEVTVVVDADDLGVEDVLDELEIDDEAGDGIDLAGEGDLKSVVVAVAVAIGALAEDALVLVRRPGVVPVEVGGRELDFAGEKDHVGLDVRCFNARRSDVRRLWGSVDSDYGFVG